MACLHMRPSFTATSVHPYYLPALAGPYTDEEERRREEKWLAERLRAIYASPVDPAMVGGPGGIRGPGWSGSDSDPEDWEDDCEDGSELDDSDDGSGSEQQQQQEQQQQPEGVEEEEERDEK